MHPGIVDELVELDVVVEVLDEVLELVLVEWLVEVLPDVLGGKELVVDVVTVDGGEPSPK